MTIELEDGPIFKDDIVDIPVGTNVMLKYGGKGSPYSCIGTVVNTEAWVFSSKRNKLTSGITVLRDMSGGQETSVALCDLSDLKIQKYIQIPTETWISILEVNNG